MPILLVFALSFLYGRGLVAQQVPATEMTFDEANTRLRQVSDALAAATANVRSKDALQRGTQGLRLPDITVDSRELRFQKTLALGPFNTTEADWRLRPSVSIILPIYTGGRIAAMQNAAAASHRQADAERDVVAQTLSVDLVQTYFGLQLAERAEAVRGDVLGGLRQHLEHTLALEQQGFATKAQRLQAVVSRDQAEREHQRSVSDLATARAALGILLHRAETTQPTTHLFVISAVLGSLEQFQREAASHHPQIARLNAVREQASEGVHVQEAALKPQAQAFGQYDLNRHDALLTDSDWGFGVGIQYLLFTGNGRRERVIAARYQQDQAAAAMRDLTAQLEAAVAKAWNDLETARTNFLLLESTIAQAEENVRLQDLSFREGQATSLDVIDARLGLGRARIDRAQSAYQFDLTLAQLLELSGQSGRFSEYIRRADKVIEP
jgi:outer membrane protein TolC